MKHAISARETSGNAKKSILMCYVDPVNKTIQTPDKTSFLQVCKILDAGKVEFFLEGQKVKNTAPEKLSDLIPDDIEDMEE
jgi:hypothetical protein